MICVISPLSLLFLAESATVLDKCSIDKYGCCLQCYITVHVSYNLRLGVRLRFLGVSFCFDVLFNAHDKATVFL